MTILTPTEFLAGIKMPEVDPWQKPRRGAAAAHAERYLARGSGITNADMVAAVRGFAEWLADEGVLG